MSFNIHLIAGARPNFMKISPLWHVLSNGDWCQPKIVHTGQHYDVEMSDSFFEDLALPKPHFALGVGSGTHAEQTARVMIAYEKVCMSDPPDLVIVVGDVNSTIAAALVAKKLGCPLAHLEAGLRSYDRSMAEEINRLATDAISDILWTPSRDASENLRREGVSAEKIEFVGNIMIDSFEMQRDAIKKVTLDHIKFSKKSFGVVTLHRPSNVDMHDRLQAIVLNLLKVAKSLPLVFSVHPRTRASLDRFKLFPKLKHRNIHILEPMSYRAFMALVQNSLLLITDSGGIQEETSYLGIPCLTLRKNTERPVTVTEGTNQLVKLDFLSQQVSKIVHGASNCGAPVIDLWDGKTAERIAQSLRKRFDI